MGRVRVMRETQNKVWQFVTSNMSKLDFAFIVKQLSACVKRGRGCQHVVRAHLAGEWFSSSDEHLFVQAFELHVCTGV